MKEVRVFWFWVFEFGGSRSRSIDVNAIFFPFLSPLFSFLSSSSHVVQAPLQRVRPAADARSVPRERGLGRAVLEQARADQRVERRIGRRGRGGAAPALPPPEDLAAAGEGDDGVEHGGRVCASLPRKREEREREKRK